MRVTLEVIGLKKRAQEILACPVGGDIGTYQVNEKTVRQLMRYSLPCLVSANLDGSCVSSLRWAGTAASAVQEALKQAPPKSKLPPITAQEFARLIGSDILG